MSDTEATSTTPTSTRASTPASSLPSSPSLSALSLKEVSEVDREEALKLKAAANKAFTSERNPSDDFRQLTDGRVQAMTLSRLLICTLKPSRYPSELVWFSWVFLTYVGLAA